MEERVLHHRGAQFTVVEVLGFLGAMTLVVPSILGQSAFGYAVFGLIALITVVVWWSQRKRSTLPIVALDRHGLTYYLRRKGVESIFVPWSNVAGAWFGYYPKSSAIRCVWVGVRDIEAFLAALPPQRRQSLRGLNAENGAPMLLANPREMSREELADLINQYRDAAVALEAPGQAVFAEG
jgi:hypothetical protein